MQREKEHGYRRAIRCILVILILVAGAMSFQRVKNSIPDEIFVREGQEAQLREIMPSGIVTYDDDIAVLGGGRYQLPCRLFGIVPLKTVKIQSIEDRQVKVSGDTIGIYMETDGVMIIHAGEVNAVKETEKNPAESMIKEGDYILEVNGKKLESKQQLIHMVEESGGKPMKLLIRRGVNEVPVTLKPVRTEEDVYKLGIWVRDNVQGIGTMTYVEDDGSFAALGHGISDIDTGELLQLSQGTLYTANVLAVSKGARGNPGELKGVITYQDTEKLGSVAVNQCNGISGQLNAQGVRRLCHRRMRMGLKQELKEGAASILSNVDGTVEEYGIEIQEIDYNDDSKSKNFVVHVTDQRLLDKTGGIVQGMSGSPILQNGRIVGAVTHVFVNDPTRGYGIFIENMLEH